MPSAKRQKLDTPSEPVAPSWAAPELLPSNLPSPNLSLSGHSASVYSVAFSPDGRCLASASYDKSVMLWSLTGQFGSYNKLIDFKNAPTQVIWDSADKVVSSSADKMIRVHDGEEGVRIKAWKTTSIQNSVASINSSTLIAAGGDDRCTTLYDVRQKEPIDSYKSDYQLTAICLSADGNTVYTGGIDNEILALDIRKNGAEIFALVGHRDTICGLELSPDGNSILSNSFDETVRSWDVRSFCQGSRAKKVFRGATHNSEKRLLKCSWSSDGEMVSAGSADQVVHCWDVESAEELFSLPGHKGSVLDVKFHPQMNVICSAGSDKNIIMGEL